MNIRYFLWAIRHPARVFLANDLDTLPAAYLAYRLGRAKHLVYDSHEYFIEVPEIQGRFAQRIWRFFERWIFPELKHVSTVNESIAGLYRTRYGVDVNVIKNLPDVIGVEPRADRKTLGLPSGPLLVLQGSGINVDRGGEELIEAMALLPEVALMVIGSGDALPMLKARTMELELSDRVFFKGRMPYTDMMEHTVLADIGLSLDKGGNPNYEFSLPNKLFDYLSAGLPVLVTPRTEVRKVVEEHQVGFVLEELSPASLAAAVKAMISDEAQMQIWRANARRAAQGLTWQSQQPVFESIYVPLQST
jgi:glycosyltransferase involved in cell wall biosynthesis